MKNDRLRFLSRLIILTVFAILLVFPAAAVTTTSDKPKVSCKKSSLRCGDTVQMTASNFSGTVTWTSSDKSLATISSTGIVKVIGNQSKNVRFTARSGSAWAYLELPVRKMNLNWSAKTLKVGEKLVLTLYNADHTPGWKTQDANVAAFVANSYTSDGKATVIAKKAGKTIITATFNGIKYQCLVTVTGSSSTGTKTGSTSSGTGSTTKKQTQTKKKVVKTKYTVKASSTNVVIQTAGYVDITANGEKNIAISADDRIVTCKLGEWDKDTARIYLTGVENGTAAVRITNNATKAYTTINVTVQGMQYSAAQRRANLGKVILSKGGKIKRNGTRGGYRYNSYIVYNKAKKTYTFRVVLKNSEIKCALKVTMDKKFKAGTLNTSFIFLQTNKRFKSSVEIIPKKYTYKKNLKVTVKQNPGKISTKQIRTLTNSTKNLAMEIWDLLLIEGYSYNLKGLGFTAYVAD